MEKFVELFNLVLPLATLGIVGAASSLVTLGITNTFSVTDRVQKILITVLVTLLLYFLVLFKENEYVRNIMSISVAFGFATGGYAVATRNSDEKISAIVTQSLEFQEGPTFENFENQGPTEAIEVVSEDSDLVG